MDKKTTTMLERLQDAIHDAIAHSAAVNDAMDQLESMGICPSLAVDVTLPEKVLCEVPTLELVTRDGPLALTDSDELFMRSLGIQVSMEGANHAWAPRYR